MLQEPVELSWRSAEVPPALSRSAVHLWRLSTGAAGADPEIGVSWLSPQQQARARALRRPEVRLRYLQTQIGLRRILAGYLQRHPREIRIERSPTGKPYLVEADTDLVFNLTTAGDIALIAVGAGDPLGIDCEPVRDRPNLEAIAERMFPASITAAIRRAPPPERLHRFHLAWTALEADVKADGRGLFRERDPAATPPRVSHCVPARGYLAAVARIDLAPPETWTALEPRHPSGHVAGENLKTDSETT